MGDEYDYIPKPRFCEICLDTATCWHYCSTHHKMICVELGSPSKVKFEWEESKKLPVDD